MFAPTCCLRVPLWTFSIDWMFSLEVLQQQQHCAVMLGYMHLTEKLQVFFLMLYF